MAALKVLHLITGLDRGGAQSMLMRLVTHMDRARILPVVASLLDAGAYGAELAAADVRFHALGLARGGASPWGLPRLLRVIRRERPDLLQTWLYHADLLGLMALPFCRRLPLVWNLRGSDMQLQHYSRQAMVVRKVLGWASALPAAIIVNSEAGRRFHESIGYRPRRWEVVPNGFDCDLFRPDARSRATLRAQLGVGDTQPLVGMVARVDPMKDHATFLAAAAMVAAAQPEVAFVLVGAGTEALDRPPALAGRLHVLGERGDVHAILPAFDVAVLASLSEGFPNVVGEAMACGVPCIAADVGDAAVIIAGTGSVVPPVDPARLATAVVSLLAHGSEGLGRLGAAARLRIIEHYSVAVSAGRYARIYEELVSARIGGVGV